MNPVDAILALLFVSEGPVTLEELALTLSYSEGQVDQILETLSAKLSESGPLQVLRISNGIQLSTKPEYAEIITAFLQPQPRRLSRSLLETLAIVAYRQPVTMGEIEEIRGVQSDYTVHILVDRGLLEEVGKKASPGRPSLYGTTSSFLHQFNLNDLSQLPELQATLPFPSEVLAEES